MAVNGKNKGNTYERKISKLLSERFEQHTGIKTAFFRNANSGAFFGGKNQYRTKTHDKDHQEFGDVICPKNFKFTIECKHYKTAPSWKQIITQNVKQWDTWIDQASTDSKNANKEFLLVIKYNNVDDFVISSMEFQGINKFGLYKSYNLYLLEEVLKLKEDSFFD